MLRLLCLLGSLAAGAVPTAALPPTSDPLYKKGYLDSYYYNLHSGENVTDAQIAQNTANLQQALNDARQTNYVFYLRSGTYKINNTLKAWVQTREKPDWTNNNIVVVGSTKGTRPIIKLKANANGFGDPTNPKVMLEFRNFPAVEKINGVEKPIGLPADGDVSTEQPNAGYGQMLRNITLHCNGEADGDGRNDGAIGLYFNHAQDSSIENVNVIASGALCGIRGIPARAWGGVEITVVGGKYGIDTTAWPGVEDAGNIGSVIAGVRLIDQTESAIRHPGQVLTVVGFEINTREGADKPAITIAGSSLPQSSCLNLIDGIITLDTGFNGGVAVLNSSDRNIYLRNVYVTGGDNLVTAGGATETGAGMWKRIDEYNFCNNGPEGDATAQPPTPNRETWTIINGQKTKGPRQISSVTDYSGPPPGNLVGKHIWASLPSVDDDDYYDPVGADEIKPGIVLQKTFQDIIDYNPKRKIFLRPGVYQLTGKITLKRDTILFGAARHLTTIEAAASWQPTSETAMIDTEAEANATTYIGDLGIGLRADNYNYDRFVALDWQAGRNSMVHISRPFHSPRRASEFRTQPHTMLKIRNQGGGRWYFLGRGEAHFMQHADFRILKVENTSEALSIYGLNMEHARSDKFAEFINARNVRIYCIKTEFGGEAPSGQVVFDNSTLLSFNGVQNVGLFGHSALRHAPANPPLQDGVNPPPYNVLEFLGSSDKLLASLIVPQKYNVEDSSASGNLLHENLSNVTNDASLIYVVDGAPLDTLNGVSLYKRGTITRDDDDKMGHATIAYADLPLGWDKTDIGAPGKVGSSYFGSGTYNLHGSGANISGNADNFHFAYQKVSGNCTITARVASQQNTGNGAKAGVMIRGWSSPGARFAAVYVKPYSSITTPANTATFQYRSTFDGAATTPPPPASAPKEVAAPYWVRVKRVGNTLTGWASVDGDNWYSTGSITMSSPALPTEMFVGLINCGTNDATLNTSVFDNVSIITTP